MNRSHSDNVKVFKAFCDETRLMILELLQSGEKCACVLLEKISVGQSTLSHHTKILVESGVVLARKEGKWTYFSISPTGMQYAVQLLQQFATVAPDKENLQAMDCCK
jgi:ArsR family transcriptional regulator